MCFLTHDTIWLRYCYCANNYIAWLTKKEGSRHQICQKTFNPVIPTFESRQIEVSQCHKQLHRGF